MHTLLQDAAALRTHSHKHIHGLGKFSYWDVLMLRGSDGKRQGYNRSAAARFSIFHCQ